MQMTGQVECKQVVKWSAISPPSGWSGGLLSIPKAICLMTDFESLIQFLRNKKGHVVVDTWPKSGATTGARMLD